MKTYKVVDDCENMIYDPVLGKEIPGHKRVMIDGLTGRELEQDDFESPAARSRRLSQEAIINFKDDLQKDITLAKARGEYTQPWLANTPKKTENMVLSEFVKGKSEAPMPKTTYQMPTMFSDTPEQIHTDIPGSLYAHIAEQEIAVMKAQGHKYAFINMDVSSALGTTFLEFKAILKDQGCEVNTQEIAFTSTGPTYKVMITW